MLNLKSKLSKYIQNNRREVLEGASNSSFSKTILLVHRDKQIKTETSEDLVLEELTMVNKKETISICFSREKFKNVHPLIKKMVSHKENPNILSSSEIKVFCGSMENSHKKYGNTRTCRGFQDPTSKKFSLEQGTRASKLESQTKKLELQTKGSEQQFGEGSHFQANHALVEFLSTVFLVGINTGKIAL